jgi:aspartate/methionine/tyrosine aminotransferase
VSPTVLTWSGGTDHALASERLRRLSGDHHAMWNYVTYRDAIGILGLDPDALYPLGATRLDPAEWADLGWLTCFAGPPPAAVEAMRAAVSAEALNQYTPDLIEPLRDEAARVLGVPRGDALEVIGTAGAQEGITLALMATVDPGDEVVVSDPGYFHVPSAVIACGARVVRVSAGADTGHRLDPDAVEAAIGPRTRAVVLVDPMNPYGTVSTPDELARFAELAERHGLLLVHDVTHGPIAISPGSRMTALPALGLTGNAVATFSVSHCWGMAGARVGFLAGPPALMRGCLRLKAALTRLNTNLVAQTAALEALRDPDHLDHAGAVVRRNLAHLEATLTTVPGLRLVVRPVRGLACAVDVTGAGISPQELMVALFARRVAVYPGDGLGESAAASVIRINLSRPDPWAMEHLRAVLPDAVAEARSGRWREPVAALLDGKGTGRARRLAATVRRGV